MHNRADHLELLSLIEDELDVATAAQMRKRLASEPRVLEAIERMRQDRTTLRGLGEVQVPTAVLDQLELLLARPMLVEPLETAGNASGSGEAFATPGQFRRQYRRQALRIRWRRLAIAAALLIAALAGVWAAVNGLLPKPNPARDPMIARNEQPAVASPSPSIVQADEDWLKGGTLHHAAPQARRAPSLAASTTPKPAPADDVAGAQTLVAEFAIVVHAGDVQQVESTLASIAQAMERPVALVRNFSFAEATRIAEEARVARGAARREAQPPPVVASGSGRSPRLDPPFKSLAEAVRRQISDRSSASPQGDRSGRLSGPQDIAPSLEQQLDFSSRGATHSVAVPVRHLKTFLEQVAMSAGQSTSLRLMPQRDHALTSDALSAWVNERAKLQQSFDRVLRASPDAVVLIPVIVQQPQ